MTEPELSMPSEDDQDLPRTLRRAKAERERQTTGPATAPTGRRGAPADAGPSYTAPPQTSPTAGSPAFDYEYVDSDEVTVTRINVPFFHLMGFFLKAVFAAIPAMVVFLVILYGIGELIEVVAPELLQMKIIIMQPQGS